MATLSVDDLLTMNDADVAARVSGTFLTYLKAVPDVATVFFKDHPSPPPFPSQITGIRSLDLGWLKSISVALVCAATAKLVVRNFNALIDRDGVNAYLDRELAPDGAPSIAAGEAVYDALFAAYAISRHGTAFQNYLADQPAYWGGALVRAVMSARYRDQIDIKFNVAIIEDRARLCAQLYLIVYMVGRLLPGERDSVERAFRDWYPYAFSDTAVSRLVRADCNDGLFFESVTAVANTRKRMPTVSIPGARNAIPTSQYQWGGALLSFLYREAQTFRTSVRADDWEVVGAFSCFTGDTAVQLVDGSARPIKSVLHGDKIQAADGAVTLRAYEDGTHTLEVAQAIFGINDTPPFFSAAHVFLSTEGMKAMDPDAVRAINPDIVVSKMTEGDTLFRLASTQPFAVEAITVERISVGHLAADECLYALVLDGPQTYFANGFCVGANYAALTEARIADGIAGLSEQEQAQLRAVLCPVMPLLLTTLRGFAGERLQGVLRGSGAAEAAL